MLSAEHGPLTYGHGLLQEGGGEGAYWTWRQNEDWGREFNKKEGNVEDEYPI